jgi:flagellar assembly protein FliH
VSAFQLPTLQPTFSSAPPSAADEHAMLEQRMQQGQAEGYAVGHAEGLAQGRAELEAATRALQQAAAELTARRDALCDAVEPAAISLALAGAEQVVGAALAVQPDLILEAARGALRRLVERDHVTVLVNPDDLDRVRLHAPELVEELGGIGALDVQVERRIAPGGVIVQTPEGDVDARLDTRFARLGDVVRDALRPQD